MTTCQLTDVQKVLLMISLDDGPAFKDACDHEADSYQFTVEGPSDRKVDVYLYDYHDGRQGVCMRHSDLCSDYSSGPVEMWIRGLHQLDGEQRYAIEALIATHHVRLTPREKANR